MMLYTDRSPIIDEKVANHLLSHAQNDNDEDYFDDYDAPKLAERHFWDEFTESTIDFAQAHARMVDLVWYLLDHLCLLPDFCSEILILFLDMLHDDLNLVEVSLLPIDLLPLHLDQLLARLSMQILLLSRTEAGSMVSEGGHLVLGRVIDILCSLSLFNHVLNVCSPRLNDLYHGLGWVIDLDPLLTPLHEDLFRHFWLSNEHLIVVALVVGNQLIVVVDNLLQLAEVQLLLTDSGSQVIVLFRGAFPISNSLHALLQIYGKFACQLSSLFGLFNPGVKAGAWLLPDDFLSVSDSCRSIRASSSTVLVVLGALSVMLLSITNLFVYRRVELVQAAD